MTDRQAERWPLDTPPEGLNQLLDVVTPRLTAWLEALPDAPAQATRDIERHLEALQEAPPEQGAGLDGLLDTLFRDVIPHALETGGPGYLAYVPGGGLISAAVADLIASITNRYVGVFAGAPAAAELETQVIRWMASLMGFPDGSLGVATTGGSMSNLIAVVAARTEILGDDLEGARAYVSSEIHHCMTKALRIAGIPAGGVREVPTDPSFRLDVPALKAAIAADRAAGLRPFLVCGSAGTVNTGAVDPLDEIADVARDENLWFHVDGAYGALFRLVPGLADRLSGMERADSLAVDPHKGLFLAYGTGMLLVQDPDTLLRSHGADAAYLPDPVAATARVDFCNVSPELSRDWRGLRLWLPFKLHGVATFRQALAEKHHLAVHLAEALVDEADVELAHPPTLSLFAFRQRQNGASQADENAHNAHLLERINRHQRIMLTATTIDGIYWIRICVLHLRTHRPRIEEAIAIIRTELRA